jgi:hypothetical protein
MLGPLATSISSENTADQFKGVIQDAKFKRREALADLAKASMGKGQGKNQ